LVNLIAIKLIVPYF